LSAASDDLRVFLGPFAFTVTLSVVAAAGLIVVADPGVGGGQAREADRGFGAFGRGTAIFNSSISSGGTGRSGRWRALSTSVFGRADSFRFRHQLSSRLKRPFLFLRRVRTDDRRNRGFSLLQLIHILNFKKPTDRGGISKKAYFWIGI
jgi:hypothetical protein